MDYFSESNITSRANQEMFAPQNVFKISAFCAYFRTDVSMVPGGVSAGAIAQYIASPTDLVKVQLQMEGRRRLMGLPPRVNGIFDAFNKVWATGGVRGLWKGTLLPTQHTINTKRINIT